MNPTLYGNEYTWTGTNLRFSCCSNRLVLDTLLPCWLKPLPDATMYVRYCRKSALFWEYTQRKILPAFWGSCRSHLRGSSSPSRSCRFYWPKWTLFHLTFLWFWQPTLLATRLQAISTPLPQLTHFSVNVHLNLPTLKASIWKIKTFATLSVSSWTWFAPSPSLF